MQKIIVCMLLKTILSISRCKQLLKGVLAVIERKKGTEQIDYNDDIIVALDGIQDPGDLGTILRTVDSANLKQIILSKNSADPYNQK